MSRTNRLNTGLKAVTIAMLMGAAAMPLVAVSKPAPTASKSKPNIIFILTDDQRYDEVGLFNPTLRTPNLDRLGREGAIFKNAFVTTSLCSPSRASILTGRYVHDHGVVDNNAPLPPGTPLVSERIRDMGYSTAFIGKWHMGGDGDNPEPGFDHWVSFAGQGNYWPDQVVGETANSAMGNVLNVDGKHVPQKGYITDELTDYAIDWLTNGRDKTKPFFLYLSHKALHADFKPASRHLSLYSDARFPDPPSMADTPENYDGKPMWVRNQRNSWHGVDFPYHSTLSMEEYRREYARTLAAVDDSVGRVLDLLQKQGLLDNTIVIFTSDNGFMFGEHGLIDKRNAYEESIRVPLLVYAPGYIHSGTVVDRMVANVDFAPTFVDIANGSGTPAEAAKGFAGMSWLPLAEGQPVDNWRTELLYEYYWEFNYPMTPTTFALRGDRYKLIQYHGIWDTEELYDLKSDPHEMHNLIDDPALLSVKVAMRQNLYDQLTAANGSHVIPYTRKFNSGAVFRNVAGSPTAVFPERWMRHPGDKDLDQHFLPDGPDKEAKMRTQQKY